jgi:virginiamycin B lyase
MAVRALRRAGGTGLGRVALAAAVVVGAGVVPSVLLTSPASASGDPLTGAVQCSFGGRVTFASSLTPTSNPSLPSRLRAILGGCQASQTYYPVTIKLGSFAGSFATPPLSCASLSAIPAPLSGTLRWAGTVSDIVNGGPGWRLAPTSITADVTSGSFAGQVEVSLNVPSTLAAACTARRGLHSIAVTGTITIGPVCAGSNGPITLFPEGGTDVCGSRYATAGITTGPDGALWLTAQGDFVQPSAIGRMTTSGAVTWFPTGTWGATKIVTGPDGALWFTNAASLTTGTSIVGGSIGRITTSGVVTIYPVSSGDPYGISVGPDGALWFTVVGSGPVPGAIGRITTTGAMTEFTEPNLAPQGITAGPDGALWFTNTPMTRGGPSSIGRITTAGAFTNFYDPSLFYPEDITAGPDGALWFTDHNSIGRVTTSGAVSNFTGGGSVSNAFGITSGPDGALWFTNYNDSVGRITTDGVVTTYSDPGMSQMMAITSGPDGAMWFAVRVNDAIGRITTP